MNFKDHGISFGLSPPVCGKMLSTFFWKQCSDRKPNRIFPRENAKRNRRIIFFSGGVVPLVEMTKTTTTKKSVGTHTHTLPGAGGYDKMCSKFSVAGFFFSCP